MRSRSVIWFFVPLVVGIPVSLYAFYLFSERQFGKLPVFGKTVVVNGKKTDHRVPSFELTNQDGEVVTVHQWEGKITVVDFFFTHCPTICPKMTNSLKKVQQAFAENDIAINSFSIDPERDDAAQLKRYAAKFRINTSNWNLITGDKKEIYRLARNGFLIVATDGDGGPNDFIHSEKLVLIDKHKRIRGYYDGTDDREVNALIKGIKKLKNEK